MVIVDRIKEKGLKKNFLAKRLKISPTLLSFFLNGQRPMPERIEIELKEILK